MDMRTSTPSRFQNLVLLLLIMSSGLNLLLGYKLRSYSRVIDILQRQGRLQVGTIVPNIAGKTPEGKPIVVDFATQKKPTVLYVFTPTCHWCARNFDNMWLLSHKVSDRFSFVGVSLEDKDVENYVKGHNIDYPVVANISSDLRSAYKMGGTPATIVMSPNNRVTEVWTGVYTGAVQTDIEKYFDLHLPGLLPNQNAKH